MKLTKLAQNFKITKNSPIADQVGKKRDSVEYEINCIEAADVPDLATKLPEEIAKILNDSLEQHAKKLFAAHQTDWNYSPTVEEVTIENVYAELTKVSARGSRLLTKETLKDFATYYIKAATEILGKSEKVAQNGATLIEGKFASILGNPAAIEAMKNNLFAISESDEFDDSYAEILAGLLEILTEATQVEVDAEAL